jgi:hypothetical protein
MIPAVRYSKNADSAVLREKPIIPPRNASAIGRTLPRIYKKILSRDTKLAILRELRKVIPVRRAVEEEGESADPSIPNLTIAEQALNGNLGRRFQITRPSRMAMRLISTLEKQTTSLFQAVNQKTRPEQLQLARRLRKKGGHNFFLATRECFSGWQLATVWPLLMVSILGSCHSSSGVYLGAHLFED